jgi:molybdate transport system regulatory protein
MSYQKAWTLIDQANRNARLPLIRRKRGGISGGGAEITNEGRKLITEFRELQIRFDDFLQKSKQLFDS